MSGGKNSRGEQPSRVKGWRMGGEGEERMLLIRWSEKSTGRR